MINIIWIIFGAQIVIGVVIFLVLMKLLDDDLQELAIEKLQNLPDEQLTKSAIKIITHKPIQDKWKLRLEQLSQRKKQNLQLQFVDSVDLKGGMVIEVGAQTIDCSLTTRLKNFW